MKNRFFKDKAATIGIISIGLLITVIFYGKILISPNDYMFNTGGDGMKNYFTYAYHIKHDTGYTNFEGMNYPYRENIMYTDCHPVLADLFKFLSNHFPYFETHSIGLLNLILIISIFLTFIVIYFLLIESGINKFLSILFSVSITLLSPQLFRLSGHYALSYSLAIPLSWLITIKFLKKKKIKYTVLLFLNNMFWLFIHAYLGVILLSFLLMIFIFKIIIAKKQKLYVFFSLIITIVLPILIFYVYTNITDIHEGRTDNPSGFFLYNAEIDDILLPGKKPFGPLLDRITGGIIKLEWEANGYIGLVNSFLFAGLFVFSILSVFSKKKRSSLKNIFKDQYINISLAAAGVILLFAMAVPFKQIPGLIDILPVFKQFRATGRFVWPFYFAFTVFAAYFFQTKVLEYFKSKKILTGTVILIIVFGIPFVEGLFYHSIVSKNISGNKNLFNPEQIEQDILNSLNDIDESKYQAVLSIPFFHYGSENFSRPRNDEAVKNSMLLSYYTGIPNICANLTRVSVEESKRIIQLMTPNYYGDKEISNDLKNDKDILVIKTGDQFTKYEQIILSKSKLIARTKDFEILSIRKEDLLSDDRFSIIDNFNKRKDTFREQNSFLVSDTCSVLYYNSWEDLRSDTVFRGNGSFSSVKKGKNTFAELPPFTFEKNKEYDLSLWMYNGEKDALNLWFRLIIEEYDEENEKWFETVIFPEEAETIYGDWSLVEGSFRINDPKNKIFIVSKGKDNSKASLHVDDLLVKDKGIDVYRTDDNCLFFNNHKIRIEKE